MREGSKPKALQSCSRPRHTRNAVSIAIAVALLAPSSARAADIGTLKNLRLGMSMHEVEHLQGEGFTADDFRCSESTTTGSCSARSSVAQISASISLFFVNTAKQLPTPLTFSDRRMMSEEQIRERRSAALPDLKLAAIRVEIDSDEHDELLDAMRAKLGQPAEQSVDQYSNAFGAKVSGMNSRWVSGQVAADIRERCGSIDETCLYIQSAPLMKRYRAFDEPSAKDRQKDL